MRYRTLGGDGIRVSEIGFGSWGLGGTAYGPTDDEVSVKTLLHAHDHGVTFYDTADLYGDGKAEELVGRALKKHRSEVVIATKGGTLPHSGFYMPQDFSPAYLEQALARSLKRLQTDYVDLYQMHSPDLGSFAFDDVVAFLENKKTQGVVREWGISVRSPKDGVRILEETPCRVVQANFNLIDRRAIESGLFDAARRKGAGVVARTPLCFGFLTGKIDENFRFSEFDHRAKWPKEQLKRWTEGAALFRRLSQDLGCTPTQLAIAFCVSYEGVSTVIPGMLEPAHVDENLGAENFSPLSPATLETIAEIYRSHVFFDKEAKKDR